MPTEIEEIRKELLNLFFAELFVLSLGIFSKVYTNININLQLQLFTIKAE